MGLSHEQLNRKGKGNDSFHQVTTCTSFVTVGVGPLPGRRAPENEPEGEIHLMFRIHADSRATLYAAQPNDSGLTGGLLPWPLPWLLPWPVQRSFSEGHWLVPVFCVTKSGQSQRLRSCKVLRPKKYQRKQVHQVWESNAEHIKHRKQFGKE